MEGFAEVTEELINEYLSFFGKNHVFSDELSKDLIKRGMKFVGSVIIYSYLQAIGIIYSHEENCFLFKK